MILLSVRAWFCSDPEPAREIHANDSEAYLTGVFLPGSELTNKKTSLSVLAPFRFN